jgi:tetratricopeptide (TPR) repeat protein
MQQEFARRLAEQRSIAYAEDTTFSGSAVFAALAEIEQLGRQIDENSRERAEVLALMSEVQRRRHEWEEAISLAQQSLAIQQRSGALSEPQLFDLHYAIADGAQATGDFDTAVSHYRQAVGLMATKPGLTEAQRLGVRQSLGRCLHEIAAYDEALSVNRSIVADAEREFGAEDARLTGVLNNLAQNEYKLGNFAAGEGYLHRRLQLSRDAKKLDIELDTLFQLGVLAFEQGHVDKARRFMVERLEIARARGNRFDVKAAEESNAELDRRITAASAARP